MPPVRQNLREWDRKAHDVSDRWAVLIVRDLLLGPKRFTDLQTGLRIVGANALAQRLRDLEQSGVVPGGASPPPSCSRQETLAQTR